MVTHLHYPRKYIGVHFIALFVYLKLKCAIVYNKDTFSNPSLMSETTK